MYELIISLLLILLVIGVFFNCFLPLAILYLSIVIKKCFGKDLIEKYGKAVEIGVKGAEQYYNLKKVSNPTSMDYISTDKKKLAMDIAEKILLNFGVEIKTKEEKALLSDMIEAEVYKIKKE